MEADYVLILGCGEDLRGFPTKIRDSKLFELAREAPVEDATLEAERHLFYVAGLTRCRKETFIFAPVKDGSRFVVEMDDFLTPYRKRDD